MEFDAPLFAGVDVGGTTIKLALVDDGGKVLAHTRFPTQDERGVPDAVTRMRKGLDQLCHQIGVEFAAITAVGLGTPGTMDLPKGLILEPPNLPGWRQFPIRQELQEACGGKPVVFANDAGAAAYGEFWVGSGRHYESIVLLTLGTGVGGGIIIGESSLDGAHSHGSECGHIIIDSGSRARRCSCGQAGHLEAYASATAVVARTAESLRSGMPSSLNRRLRTGDQLTALMIAEEAELGDALALEIVDETAGYLALGLVSIVHIIDPEAVILGGAMNFGGCETQVGQRFLKCVQDEFRRMTFPVLAENTDIAFATLGGDAGFIGAAGLARAAAQRPTRA